MTDSIPSIDLTAFDALAASPGVTVLDFTAAWCGPCRTLKPILVDIAATYAGRVRVVAVDVDEEPLLAQRFSVRSMPTGRAVARWARGGAHGRRAPGEVRHRGRRARARGRRRDRRAVASAVLHAALELLA
ncbi:MAG: thioredoxin family protein, partial [Deltaproteobacteria bacterium]|nr:thioredoxin family protein [Deltaproteobacteria bacterium]